MVTKLPGGGAKTRDPISPLLQSMNAEQSGDPKHSHAYTEEYSIS